MDAQPAPVVLIVDDDRAFRFALRKALRRLGYEVEDAGSGETALPILARKTPPDVALLDLQMGGMSGLDVLRRRGSSPTKIIVLTGHGTIEAAVDAMQLGAFSFLEKPVDAEVLSPLLRQATRESARGSGEDFVPPMIGESRSMREIRAFVDRIGPSDETVLLFGETGTGKEVVARHIHLASKRAGRFVALNAACVPKDLFESELFGHRKGSFTGASEDRPGLFRDAHGGTLFIDELGELPIDSQAKLLRALETKTVRPVGEGEELPVDVRIVAATNRDLWSLVEAGGFREDLYFRLQVFPVELPPLRERRDDLQRLSEHLLERLGGSASRLDDKALAALSEHTWPGNVRELLNVLRRASLFCEGEEVSEELARRMVAASIFGRRPQSQPMGRSGRSSQVSLAEVERGHIEQVLGEMDGNVTKAAVALGIDRRTLQRKLKAYGLSARDDR